MGTIIEIRGVDSRGSVVTMSNSNALPLLNLGLEVGVVLLEFRDVVKLPLSRLTSCKSVACSLQGDFVARVDRNGREGTFSTTRLADAVGGRRICDR